LGENDVLYDELPSNYYGERYDDAEDAVEEYVLETCGTKHTNAFLSARK